MVEINLPTIKLAVTVHAPTISTRMNFAVQNMMAAARFSRAVGSIEAAHAGQPYGSFHDEILHNASACIFLCCASLEAYTNEVYADRSKLFTGAERQAVEVEWRRKEWDSTLNKFEFFLEKKGKASISGSLSYGEVATLVQLRNALVHFKPEWSDEEASHAELSASLTGKFVPSEFLADANCFPRRWASHSCTQWAVKSCLAYAVDFEASAGLQPKYSAAFLGRLQS
jgi:hypothetical protein